jgi:DNA-binding MarR family transcriptional regulator
MKQTRLLKKSTLLVIKKFLESGQSLTSAEVSGATEVDAAEVRQILKRLRYDGWLTGEPKQSAGAGLRRWRYRLTTTGRRDAPKALARQATWTEENGWCVRNDPAPSTPTASPQQVTKAAPRRYCGMNTSPSGRRPPLGQETYQWSRT